MEKRKLRKNLWSIPYTTFSYYYVRRTSVCTTDSRISDSTTQSQRARITLSILMIPVKLFLSII